MDLTLDDFKQLLLDLYLVQRDNNALRAQLAERQTPAEGADEED